jgi:hypothetical protein
MLRMTGSCSKRGPALDAKDKESLKALETRYDFETIVQFRELGEALWEIKRSEVRASRSMDRLTYHALVLSARAMCLLSVNLFALIPAPHTHAMH